MTSCFHVLRGVALLKADAHPLARQRATLVSTSFGAWLY